MKMKKLTPLCCGLLLVLAGSLCAAETALIDTNTPWRAFLVLGPKVTAEDDALRIVDGRTRKVVTFDPSGTNIAHFLPLFSRLADARWAETGYDDAHWARYLPADLDDYMGDYGAGFAGGPNGGTWPALLCLRSRFGVSDPARAQDVKVTVSCLGGAVVRVNGREIGRAHLPADPINPLTPAAKYPPDAYTFPDTNPAAGTTPARLPLPDIPWQWQGRPAAHLMAYYSQRIRTFTFPVPAAALVPGANVVTVEIHQAPVAGPMGRGGWMHAGVKNITVTSAAGAGVIAYDAAAAGPRVWSAFAEEQVFDTPVKGQFGRGEVRTLWMRGKLYRGIQAGNPFDPVAPLRVTVPRNGTGSGQVVLTDLAGLRGVSAKLGSLSGPGGQLPANAVEIRYAAQGKGPHFCDALWPTPPAEARTVPVWLIVQAPKTQAPGAYTGTLTLTASDKRFVVPVEVVVSGATVPDPRDFTTQVGAASSPDTIALHYKVAPWSAEHYRLMEPSWRLLGQLGSDVLQVPVILGGMYGTSAKNWVSRGSRGVQCWPLVRWVKAGAELKPDFSLLEKHLVAYLKFCPPPQALSLYVWDSGCTREVTLAYENQQVTTNTIRQASPLLVQLWDPATGSTTNIVAPNFTDEGAAAFWQPLFEGVRQLVKKRGWSENIIMAGMGGDLRPSQREGDLVREWAPYMRWHVLSHFSGDPAPKDGKQFATGGLAIGVKGYPWRSEVDAFNVARLEPVLNDQYLDLPAARWLWKDDSPPLLFRTLPMIWGTIGQIGLDFWPSVKDAPRNSSYFTSSNSVTVPGPDGAVPTIRFQMLREGVQDMELRWQIIRAARALPPERRQAVHAVLDEFPQRVKWGTPYLSQCELSYGWPAYVAQVHQLAAELAGGRQP
jgi:hypothetical protein